MGPELRDWVKSAARGNPWRYETRRPPVAIDQLVSPLRFDVLVRMSFFDFYREHRSLYRDDITAFAELAAEHDYQVWFRRIMCFYWQPHVLEDPRAYEAAWLERVIYAADLFESFHERGFDPRYPITLYSGDEVLPTESGKRLARRLFAGDGNHRLALLLSEGVRTLSPEHFRIKRFRRLLPADTTLPLLEALDVDDDRYLSFLRMGYPSLRVERRDERFEITSAPDAATEAEVRAVLDVDTRHIRAKTA